MQQSSIEADQYRRKMRRDFKPDCEELRDLHQCVHNPVTADNHQSYERSRQCVDQHALTVLLALGFLLPFRHCYDCHAFPYHRLSQPKFGCITFV
jgi:hypothetical protein